MKKLFLAAALALICNLSYAQLLPERRFVRQGNKEFEKGNYAASEVSYMRAKQKNPNSYEANFNLAGAQYKQQRYEEAEKGYGALSAVENDPVVRSEAFYNLGNSLFEQRKLEEALEAYKNALRQNPDDQQAKFNLAYTKKLLEKDKNQDKNKDNKDNEENPKDQNKQEQEQGQDNKQDQQQQPQGGMNREEAERMLDAVQNSEDNTREKVEEQKVQTGVRSNKNW